MQRHKPGAPMEQDSIPNNVLNAVLSKFHRYHVERIYNISSQIVSGVKYAFTMDINDNRGRFYTVRVTAVVAPWRKPPITIDYNIIHTP